MNLVKKYRKFYAHKTQTELAEEFAENGLQKHTFNGVQAFTQSDISRIEKGAITPDYMLCEYIAKKLNVSPEDVLNSTRQAQRPA